MLDRRDLDVSFSNPEAMDDPARREAALALLTPEERERVARFVFEHDRRLHLAARALLRRSLSRCSGVPPGEWRFAAAAGGRPEIVSPASPLRFSVSHTRGLAMVAIAVARDVGADAERLPAAIPFDVVDQAFSPVEREAVRSAPPEEQAARFAEIWTLKEAYAKARGLGLALPLHGVGFELAPPRLLHGDDPSGWQLETLRPTAAHRAALCVRLGGEPPVQTLVRWDPSEPCPLTSGHGNGP